MIQRRAVNPKFKATLVLLMVLATTGVPMSRGESVLPLLAGFDVARVESTYPPDNDDATGELAKLLYRLQKVDPAVLDGRAADPASEAIGEAIRIQGDVQSNEFIRVPAKLVEFLDMAKLQRVSVRTDRGLVTFVTPPLKNAIKRGDRVAATGVVIEAASDSSDPPSAIAAARVRWTPRSTGNQGWDLLSRAGLDVSLLADLASRDRKPLSMEDGDAFYTMMAAADDIGGHPQLPVPATVKAVEMLQDPQRLGGQWLRLDVETVQVTRIAVTEPQRQTQLGTDRYYQIDAFADLGNVVIRVEPTETGGSPAVFENRYPVSIVTMRLPPFLAGSARTPDGSESIVADTRRVVRVDGFFFRLWSYSTDYMQSLGAGDQFGPLLVAARWSDREPRGADPTAAIGWIAAAGVFIGVAAIWLWHRRNSAQDQAVRRKQRSREAEQLELPRP